MFPFAEKSSRFLARLLAVGLLLFGLVSIARADLTSGLVAYYPFDGNASDMSGNGNDGTVNGATPGADRHGASGKAYGFDGSNDYIQMGNDDSLNVSSSSPFTFGFWFKPGSSQAGGITIKNGQYGFQWQGSSSSVRYYDNTYRNSGKTSWNLNEWHHMAMVQTGSHLYLYVNGQPDSNHSTTYNPALVSDSLYIGKHPTYFGAFDGSIDEVRIYNRALSAVEVAALYQLENTPPNQPPVFAESNATFTTAENNASANFVVTATDPDANTTLAYTKSGPDAGKFTLNVATGTLTFTNTPDYEANASAAGNNTFSLTITVTDGEANATQTVTFNVTNMVEDFDFDGIEDHFDHDDDDDGFSDTAEIAYGSDPRNSQSLANAAPQDIDLNGTTVAENQPVGTIVGDFNATDPDPDSNHTFAFTDGNGSTHNHLFTLDANRTLRTAAVLDYEANATLSIRVRATDDHNASIEKAFVIAILDDGQEDSDGDGIENHVDTDDDNDGFTDAEEIEGGSSPDDNASFLVIISGSVSYDGTATGPVLMQVRSSVGPATVTVEMLDSFGDGWNGAQLTIKDDSNQTAFSGTLPDGSGSETEVVLQAGDDYFVSVTSGDYPDEVSWNISSGSENFAEGEAPVAGQAFSPVGDVLKVILPQLGSYQLEMPNNATYELGVLLDVDEDGEPDLLEPFGFYAGGPITLSSGNLAGINIMLTNNHAPADLHLSNVTIAENQPAGTIVGDFNATDLNANSTHTFAFTDGNGSTHHHLFAIDANGTLRTAAVLDYEANASLSVSVRVTDEENASLEKVLHILVHNDVHEDADADGLKEFEEETLGTSDLDDDSDGDGAKDGDEFAIGSDPDSNASFPVSISGTVTYGETAGGQVHVLAMEGSGGVVAIEMVDSYGDGWNGTELTIVDDANVTVYVGTFYKGHEASVTIDLVPERTYVVNVSEGEYPEEVSWEILADGEVLASGEAPEEGVTFAAPGIVKEVVLAQAGTYQLAVPSNLAYQVGAFLDLDGDGEIGPLEPAGFHSEEPVTANGNLSGINVEMVGNAAPTDLALSVGAVTENHQTGSFVGVFTVNDPDDLNGSGLYSIDLVDGNGSDHDQHFAIEGNQLKAVSPDYESGPVHSIRVRASDDRGAAIENTFFITVVDDPRDNPLELGNSRLFAPESAWEDRFGSAVSLLDDLLAVGATRADGLDHNETGAVYLYQVDANGSATYLVKVTAPDGAEEDEFGSSVSQAGDLLAIGATRADGVDHNGTGAVYLYQVDANGSAAYLAKVMAPDGAEDDWFGSSISQTGDLLAIGAGRANGMDQNHTGAAYLYRTESNGSATYLAKLAAPDGAEDDWFGGSISQAGDLLVIGAPRANGIDHNHTGAAYLYRTESNGSATYLAKLTLPDDSENDGVGFSVSVSGNIVVVGAWGVESEENGDAGAAYVYRVETNGSATHATYLTKLTAPDAVSFTYFGYQVSQSGDLLAIGSNNGIYMYRVDANGSVTGLKKANIQDVAEEAPFDDGAISLTGELLAVGMMLFDPEGDEEETGVDEEEVDPEEDATGTVYLFNLASLNNKPPSHLHLSGVTVARNKAPGTVVGQLQAVDPDDQNGTGEYYFEFVEGNGSQHNHLFAIDTNGTLRSTTVLDHEANITLGIRIRATDEHNASIEQTFVITVLDDPTDNNTSVVEDNGTFVDTNATYPDNNTTVPDSNGTYVDTNATVSDGNGTFVDANPTSPDNNGTIPHQNGTFVDTNATFPDQNGTHVDDNAIVVDANGTLVDTNGTFVDDNATLPDSNATVPNPDTTPPDQNETIVEPHEPHADGNGTVPDQNETIAPPAAPTYPPIARTLRAETEAEGRLKLNGVDPDRWWERP